MASKITSSSALEAAFPSSTTTPTQTLLSAPNSSAIALITAAIIVVVLATVVIVALVCVLRRRKRKARANMERGFERESGFKTVPLQNLVGTKMAHVLIKDIPSKHPSSPKHDPRFVIGDDGDSDDESKVHHDPKNGDR